MAADCAPVHERTRAVLEELQFCRDLLDAQQVSMVGYPMDWPPDVPSIYSAESVALAVQSAADECAGVNIDHLWWDCEEFPCLVFQFIPAGEPRTWAFRECDSWPYTFTRSRDLILRDGGRVMVAPVAPTRWCRGEPCVNYDRRWEYRSVAGLDAAREVWEPVPR